MQLKTCERLLLASRAAASQWRDYLDDTRPAGPDEWVALVAVMRRTGAKAEDYARKSVHACTLPNGFNLVMHSLERTAATS